MELKNFCGLGRSAHRYNFKKSIFSFQISEFRLGNRTIEWGDEQFNVLLNNYYDSVRENRKGTRLYIFPSELKVFSLSDALCSFSLSVCVCLLSLK